MADVKCPSSVVCTQRPHWEAVQCAAVQHWSQHAWPGQQRGVAHPHSVDEADDANGDEDDGDGEEDQGDDTLGQHRLARAKLLLSDFCVCNAAQRATELRR